MTPSSPGPLAAQGVISPGPLGPQTSPPSSLFPAGEEERQAGVGWVGSRDRSPKQVGWVRLGLGLRADGLGRPAGEALAMPLLEALAYATFALIAWAHWGLHP